MPLIWTDKSVGDVIDPNDINKVANAVLGLEQEIETPYFNLTEMGLPALSLNTSVTASGDMTELIGALKSGAVKLTLQADFDGEGAVSYTLLTSNSLVTPESTVATAFIDTGNQKVSFNLIVLESLLLAFLKTVYEVPAPDATLAGKILSVNAEGNSAWVEAPSAETPVFDLASLGLPNIPYGNENGASLETDTTEIMAALAKGEVTFKLNASFNENIIPFTTTLNPLTTGTEYICAACAPILSELDCVYIVIAEGYIGARVFDIKIGGEEEALVTSIDLSAFGTDGIIAETYSDGTTKRSVVEFDASGNPIKITDGDGNVTEITW